MGSTGGYPYLAVSPDGFCVTVWEGGAAADVFFSGRPPKGKWSTNEKVNKKSTETNPFPSIAISGSHKICVAWNDWYGDHNTDIFVSYKTPEDTFSDHVNITNTPSKCEWGPILATDTEDNLYCIWSRTDGLYFSYCPKGGKWSEEETITDDLASCPAGHSMAIDKQGIVYAVWGDYRNSRYFLDDIYSSFRSQDGIWSPNIRLNNDSGFIWQGFPEIGVDGFGNLHCIWADTLPGGTPYIYRPAGGEWSEPIRLGSDYVGVYSLVVDEDGNAYALMGERMKLLYRPFEGEWREIITQFADDSAIAGGASLKVDKKKNLYCIWLDFRYGWNNPYIFFRMAENIEAVGERDKKGRKEFWLSNPLPNPMRNFTSIKYQVASREPINLEVYDATGRPVRTLLRAKDFKHRAKSITWDGRDDEGRLLPSGVYFISLKTEDYSKTQKVILFR